MPYLDTVFAILTSLGGASVIAWGLVKWVGNVWADKIAKNTFAKYEQELEVLKATNNYALEEFKKRANAELSLQEKFGDISFEVYQEFFKNRVSTYTKLLEVKNYYISNTRENIVTNEMEKYGYIYHSSYLKLRSIIIENQLYISTGLDETFHQLRLEAAKYTKEADLIETYVHADALDVDDAIDKTSLVYENFAEKTAALMSNVIRQIDTDVSKLRARIDLDSKSLA